MKLSPSSPSSRYAAGLILIICLVAAFPSFAASSLSFVPIEESKYLFKGEGVREISSVSLTVNYDTTYLSAPEVTVMGVRLRGDGVASSSPGNLQLQIVNDDRNNNIEVCIYFQKQGDYPAVINFVTADIVDLSGHPKPMPVEMVPSPNSPPAEDTQPLTLIASGPADHSSHAATENPALESESPAEDKQLPGTASPLPKKPMKAVFESFREFNGPREMVTLTVLFADSAPGLRQTPAVLMADGRQTARVVISGIKERESAPHFAVIGGNLVSMERGGQEEWVLVVLPAENEWNVRVVCSAGGETTELPLVVAPPIGIAPDKLASLDENGFLKRMQSFIAENRQQQKQQSPVWLQEYFFTANYLAARSMRSYVEDDRQRRQSAETGRERRDLGRSR